MANKLSQEDVLLERISNLFDRVADNKVKDFKSELDNLTRDGQIFHEIWTHANRDMALYFIEKIVLIIDEHKNPELLQLIAKKLLNIFGRDSIDDLMLSAIMADSVYIAEWLSNNIYDLSDPAMKEQLNLCLANLATIYESENILYTALHVLKTNPDSMYSLSEIVIDHLLDNAVNENNLDDFSMIYGLKYNILHVAALEDLEAGSFGALLGELLSSLSIKAAGANAVEIFAKLNALRLDAGAINSPEYIRSVFEAASNANSIGIVALLSDLSIHATTHDDRAITSLDISDILLGKRRDSGDSEGADSGLDDSSISARSPMESPLLGGIFPLDASVAVY
jgi:hypothetical protein